ncbi:MAG: nuclear transport factor 2 family protein [Ignavibacteriaceae bacterium]
MSVQEENIVLVQKMYTAFTNRNIDAMLAMLSNEVEWGEPSNPFNETEGTRYGHKGFLEWVNIGRQVEEIFILEPRKYLTDNDSVAVYGYMKCLVKSTEKIYESDFVHLVTIKDGLIVKFQEFFDTYIAGEAFRKK